MTFLAATRTSYFGGLHFSQYGTGRPVILLHGYGETSFSWRYLVNAASEQFAFFCIDLRGCGRSVKPRDEHYAPSDQANLIAAFIVEAGLTNLSLVGHSMGGGIALLTGLTLQARGQAGRLDSLVLIDPMALPQRIPWFITIVRNPILGPLALRSLPSKLIVRTVLHQAFHDPSKIEIAAIDAYADNLATSEGRYAQHQIARRMIPDDVDRLMQRYRDIRVPSLLLWGDDDRIIPPENGVKLQKLLPAARLETIITCGHIPHEEQPQQAIPAIRSFLAAP